jgi:hypothetical protein
MLHEAYYLIKPKDSLWERANALALSDIDWLLEPQLWRKGEPDRSPWSRDDHLAQIKLLFLAWLRSEYEAHTEYKSLFGQEAIDIEAFDAWWLIERFYFPEPIEEIEGQLKPQVIQGFTPTGKPNVDHWISELRARTLGEE